jgi:hypothetical protein
MLTHEPLNSLVTRHTLVCAGPYRTCFTAKLSIMDFPDKDTISSVLPSVEFPRFAEINYEPPAPELNDVEASTRHELDELRFDELSDGARVAIGLGSRGIHDIVPIARTITDELARRGFDPVIVPAMGSHGGATADGQRKTLSNLGLTEEALNCSIDARMDTVVLGTTNRGDTVHIARAAVEADAVLVVNRIKPHTNFDGRIESGLCKMLTVGLGKQPGAQAFHERALTDGYVSTIESVLKVILRELPILGGLAIVENFYDRTAMVEGIPASSLPKREVSLLESAYEHMPTLPYDNLDVLIVDRIGKDISGAGMDTNVIGRYRVLNTDDPESPDINRIVVRGLTESTHGNGQGIGLADITTAAAVESLDLNQMYTNALTSSSLSKANLPIVLPDDEHALTTALSTIGPYDSETVRIAWIHDTAHLSSFRVSEALINDLSEHETIEGTADLTFEDGTATFKSV